MDNQESELSVDMSSTGQSQNLQSMYGMSQQNQQMPFNQNTSMYGNNPMNMSSSNFAQAPSQGMGQPNNFSSYGNFGGQNANMMPNQGMNNMQQPGMEWFSNAMRNYPQQQQQQQQQQMMPNMNQNQGGLNPMEFFAMANSMIMNNNNNMYRNPMNQFMQGMNPQQPMNPSYNNLMNPNMFQNMMSGSRGFDSQKFDDSFSQNMNMGSMNDFYKMMNSNANTNFNTGMNNTPLNVRKGTTDSEPALPNRTEFTQGAFGGGSLNGFQSTVGSGNLDKNESAHFGNEPEAKGKISMDDLNTGGAGRANTREDDRPIRPMSNQAEDRGKFDWEDKPIKSNYNSKKNNPPEYDEDNYDDPRGASQNSADYQAREYKNPYDDVPVSMNKNKRFEDLLEEELKANPDAVSAARNKAKPAKKTFLKRGTRAFLASAGTGKNKNQKENISSLNDIQDDNPSTGFPSTKSSSLKPNNNFGNQMERASKTQDKFHSQVDVEDNTEQRQTRRSKETKKFLTRGAGKGGGVGNPLDGKQRKTHMDDEGQERSEERSKSVNPKGKKKGAAANDGYTDRTLKTEKSTDKLKISARNDLYPENGHDTQSLEREYNMDKYLKKSPKGRKMMEAKQRKSPKYVFDEGNESDGDNYRGDNEYVERAETVEDGPAPISNLVNKYFYKGQPARGNQGGRAAAEEQGEEETGDENVQKFVNEKIEILNSEIAKFKIENERVKKIRQKHEEMLRNLNKDIAEWNKQKEKDIKEFKDWKQEELKKINNEKKLAERQQKTLANMPNRKEREEIDNLKKQISKMMEEMQHKEKRAKLDMERLKRQVKESEERNAELLQELRGYDQFRAKEVARGQAMNKNAYEDEEEEQGEEEEEDYDGNNKIEEQDEEEEYEGQGSDENNDLQYDDIVVKQTGAGRNVETNKGTFHSPKFVGEKTGNQMNMAMNNRATAGHAGQAGQGRDSHSAVKSKDGRAATGKWSESDYRFDTNASYLKHFVNRSEVSRIVNQTVSPDGKIQRIYQDGKKEVIFHNGVKREIFPDGYTIVHFTNNDIKQTLPDSTIVYYFADAQTTQTTLPNGLHIYRFANNQLEFHNSDGSKDIHFADGTRKVIHINGEEETVFTDGTVQRVNAQKVKTIDYANGQRDIVYPDGLKIRTYPNGRTKKYYPDGTVEEN